MAAPNSAKNNMLIGGNLPAAAGYTIESVRGLINNLDNLRTDLNAVKDVNLNPIADGRRAEVEVYVNSVLSTAIGGTYNTQVNNVSLEDTMQSIIEGDYIPYKSSMILNVPTSKELVARLVTPLWMQSKGLPVGNVIDVIKSNLYSRIPDLDYNTWYDTTIVDDNKKTNLSKWDELVKKIRDHLSSSSAGTVSSEIRPSNAVAQPVKSTLTVFNRNPNVLAVLPQHRIRVTNPAAPMPVNPLAGFRIALQNGGNFNMKGGNVSRAAPLYPTLVMNGGASPFAVMEGGGVAAAPAAWPTDRPTPNPVAILDARINAAINGFKAATNKELDGGLKNSIREYSDNTNKALKELTEKLQLLNDANKAFSQYRPGLGVDAGRMTTDQLKTMVDQIKEINERAEKASNKYSKLEEIAKTVEELAARGRGMGRNP